MAKPRTLEAKLAALRLLRGAPPSPSLTADLRAALKDASNLVVGEAAELVAAADLRELVPELVAAYPRFLEDAEKKDKQCRAKLALAEALSKFEHDDEAFWWPAARYTQHEPVWGGSQDTAAPLRVCAAFALVRQRARGALPYLADLLCDPEKPARVGAAQALAYSGTDAAALLLRLKARLGDEHAEVVGECFTGLISLQPEEAVPFVAEFLENQSQPLQETAILALGESRRAEAFESLRAFWNSPLLGKLEETLLTALALLRLPAATDFLLERVAEESPATAALAVHALAIHKHDGRFKERVAAAVTRNGHAGLKAKFEAAFRRQE